MRHAIYLIDLIMVYVIYFVIVVIVVMIIMNVCTVNIQSRTFSHWYKLLRCIYWWWNIETGGNSKLTPVIFFEFSALDLKLHGLIILNHFKIKWILGIKYVSNYLNNHNKKC